MKCVSRWIGLVDLGLYHIWNSNSMHCYLSDFIFITLLSNDIQRTVLSVTNNPQFRLQGKNCSQLDSIVSSFLSNLVLLLAKACYWRIHLVSSVNNIHWFWEQIFVLSYGDGCFYKHLLWQFAQPHPSVDDQLFQWSLCDLEIFYIISLHLSGNSYFTLNSIGEKTSFVWWFDMGERPFVAGMRKFILID